MRALNVECHICQDRVVDSALRCGHLFCSDCVPSLRHQLVEGWFTWYEIGVITCPFCGTTSESKDVLKIYL